MVTNKDRASLARAPLVLSLSGLFCLWLWLGCRAARQPHREDRAFALLARHGHVTAHHARELAGDAEAETGAAKAPRGRGIGLAELLEQLRLLLRRHANAGIDHR